jgi:Potential Queuosine, Q, salvage protein family
VVELVTEIRSACARVASRARHVSIDADAIPAYAASLPLQVPAEAPPAVRNPAAFWLTLNAINFGSGWFPTLRKRPGMSGYRTIEAGIRERFARRGPWAPAELARIEAVEIATVLGQEPDHELMSLFAAALRDLGRRIDDFDMAARTDSAVELATRLSTWECFEDVSTYDGERVPFYKRAQIAVADLARARVIRPPDLNRLTMFADNLVPHVLRLDGILAFEHELVERIDRGEVIEHDSPEEVEIRACAVHAVELIVATREDTYAAQIDELLWNRGRGARYKDAPRHRSRTTAY